VVQPLVWLVRHGATEWSRNGRHTSRTDLDLTPEGEAAARALIPVFAGIGVDQVLTSPRLRARRTADLAGLSGRAPGGVEVCDDLQEWDYGRLEGLTTPEIRESWPSWSIWDGPWPGGETADDVAARADRLIERLTAPVSGSARIVLVGHGHFSRVIGARWVNQPVASGRWLEFDTASWSLLGWDRGSRVLQNWNVPAGR
jgi:broad specificity phosphatase PhoE